MALNNAATLYQGTKVNTASPAELTLMLYEGAIKFCNIGLLGFETNDYEKVNNNIIRVQNIITELRATLDFKYPIAKDFDVIYEYISNLLVQANIKKDAEVLNQALDQVREMRDLWKEIMKQNNIDDKFVPHKSVLSAISAAKDSLISPEEYAASIGTDFRQKIIADLYKLYQKKLKSADAMDFDDLLVKTVQLLQTQPDVLEYYQERFRYIMVDEYQDTNTVQFKLISILARKYKNLCVVGDDDQSIYKFRGANIKNILDFESVFEDAHVIKLEQNYRSTETILNAANAVIANNIGRKQKRLWTENGEGEKIQFKQFDDAFEEANFVARDIQKHVDEGTRTYKDHAILYRTNAQSRIFEEKFIVANIPYKVVGGVNFYARREVKDLLAYLKTIDNGQDELAIKRIINVPKRGIGAASINKVSNYAIDKEISFYSALRQTTDIPGLGKAAEKIRPFVQFIQSMRAKLDHGDALTSLMQAILDETGYLAELQAEGTEEAEERIQNIDELISKMADYEEGEEHPTLSGFLEEVALVADIDEYDERLLRHLALGYTKDMITNLKGMPFGVKSLEKRQNELINRLFAPDERIGVNACRLVTRALELRIIDIDHLEPDEE